MIFAVGSTITLVLFVDVANFHMQEYTVMYDKFSSLVKVSLILRTLFAQILTLTMRNTSLILAPGYVSIAKNIFKRIKGLIFDVSSYTCHRSN